MVRQITIVLALLASGIAIWYLVLRPYDLKVSFEANTLPGSVEQTIKRWAFMRNGTAVDRTSEGSLLQEMGDYEIKWTVVYVNDTFSKVSANLTFKGSRISNRLNLLLPGSELKTDGYGAVKKVYELIKQHLEMTKVQVDGEATVPSKYCICAEEKTSQLSKAQGMMRNYGLISSFILSNKLETDGLPLIAILNWDQKEDSLRFNFCFPIKKQTELPESDMLFYHKLPAIRALKATYNGNYITSDRAWYELLNYANNNNFEVREKPIEFFYNNPNIGENEIRWKAEVFLPLKQQ